MRSRTILFLRIIKQKDYLNSIFISNNTEKRLINYRVSYSNFFKGSTKTFNCLLLRYFLIEIKDVKQEEVKQGGILMLRL